MENIKKIDAWLSPNMFCSKIRGLKTEKKNPNCWSYLNFKRLKKSYISIIETIPKFMTVSYHVSDLNSHLKKFIYLFTLIEKL